MRTLVIADMHGAHKALLQCLERSKFNNETDQLICLGDTSDGWSEVPECFDELLKIKNLIYIIGNHDEWLRLWLKFGHNPINWLSQGGQATVNAYIRVMKDKGTDSLRSHEAFLDKALPYYHDEQNRVFVHGGFSWHTPLEENSRKDMMWDRHMYSTAWMWHLKGNKDSFKDYNEIYIGHTSTCYSYGKQTASYVPLKLSNLWAMDQGAGYEGKLSIMDIDTKEFFQSDLVFSLYPNNKGRN